MREILFRGSVKPENGFVVVLSAETESLRL